MTSRDMAARDVTGASIADSRPPGVWSRGPGVLAGAFALIALMAIGSALMWIGIPFGLVWLASRLAEGSQPSMGPYLVILLGLPISMVVIGKLLASLDRTFGRITGYDPNNRRVHVPWLKSMRGERGSGHKRTVLDVVMIASVSFAGTAFLIWFLLFAHPGLPGG
jgi:hypothetical protein